MSLGIGDFKSWYEKNREEIMRDFFTFLSFPSVSTDPKFAGETRKTAEWLNAYLNKMGMKSSVVDTVGHPVVFATHLAAGKDRPTLLIYQHYDVQPVDPLELWQSDPFKPAVRGGQVFARGAQDNKGQCFYSITAIRSFLELAKKSNVNLKVFIEGEEESGSKGTSDLLSKKTLDLSADQLLVIDFGLHRQGAPAITLGMRGLVGLTVTFNNSRIDLHSGSHGGIVMNPNRALVSTLNLLWDKKGKIQVPGFYDQVHAPSKSELSKLDLTFDPDDYKKKFGVRSYGMENGFSALESNWLRPTLEINGVRGGYSGPGVKTVIPAKAEAKITCRLVGDQDPDLIAKSVVEFIRANAPQGIEVESEIYPGSKAFWSSPDSHAINSVAQALGEVFSANCNYQLSGASVPIVRELVEASSAQAVLFGMGLEDDNIHAPNEHFGLDRFEKGFLTVGRILSLNHGS